jgi:large subunit ribosomal protein L17
MGATWDTGTKSTSAGSHGSRLPFSWQVKAKAVRKYVDKMIQLAKDGSLHARRQVGISISWGLVAIVARSLNYVENSFALLTVVAQALAYIYDKDIVKSLFEEAPKRYGDRNGGYCRVVTEDRLRRGDAAEMAIIELVA